MLALPSARAEFRWVPLVGKFLGSSPRAVDPNAEVLPSALGRDLSRRYFKWTPKVKNFINWTFKPGLSLLKTLDVSKGGSYARKFLRATASFIKNLFI